MPAISKYIAAIFLFSLFILPACKYSKPLFLSHIGKDTIIDSTSKKEVTKDGSFLCLRNGIHKGYFSITYYYDSHKRLIEKENNKETDAGVCDGPNTSYSKEIYYDSLGRKTMVHYNIACLMILFDKTVYYNRNKIDSVVQGKDSWKRYMNK